MKADSHDLHVGLSIGYKKGWNEIKMLRKALEPFAKKTCIRSGTVVLMRKEVINARKALGWLNPVAHGGKDD